MSAVDRFQNGGHGNRKWKHLLNAMSWRHNSNSNPYINDHAGHIPGTPDIARRWLITGNQDGITEIQNGDR